MRCGEWGPPVLPRNLCINNGSKENLFLCPAPGINIPSFPNICIGLLWKTTNVNANGCHPIARTWNKNEYSSWAVSYETLRNNRPKFSFLENNCYRYRIRKSRRQSKWRRPRVERARRICTNAQTKEQTTSFFFKKINDLCRVSYKKTHSTCPKKSIVVQLSKLTRFGQSSFQVEKPGVWSSKHQRTTLRRKMCIKSRLMSANHDK